MINEEKNLAAVLRSRKNIELLFLNDPPLSSQQVRIKIKYSALCGTQVGEWLQSRGVDDYLPHCLGHEAVGEIIEKGFDVNGFDLGDKVVVSWIRNQPSSSAISPQYSGVSVDLNLTPETINAGKCCTFMRRSIVPVDRITKINVCELRPYHSLLGCALLTAYANFIAMESRLINKEMRVAIWGLGGIGLATALILASNGYQLDIFEPNAELSEHERVLLRIKNHYKTFLSSRNGEYDAAVVTVGSASALEEAQMSLKQNAGKIFVSANLPYGESMLLDLKPLLYGREVIGVGERFISPVNDIPKLLSILEGFEGINNLLVEGLYPLNQVNSVIEDLHNSGGKRRVFDIS
jgi:D-arabinose 1-dehydrogenase-like Zn-dependent alcohol dehydrogenase